MEEAVGVGAVEIVGGGRLFKNLILSFAERSSPLEGQKMTLILYLFLEVMR